MGSQQITTRSSSPQQARKVQLQSALQRVASNSSFMAEVYSAIAMTMLWIMLSSLLVTALTLARTTGWFATHGEAGARRVTSACSDMERAMNLVALTNAHRMEMHAMETPILAHTVVSAAFCLLLLT